MAEVYKHVLTEHAEDIVQCGLKLSEYGSVTVESNTDKSRYIPAFFNPKDEKDRYKKEGYTCIRITIPNEYCKVGDSFLCRDTGGLFRDLFKQSLIPIEEYFFGTYRNPICLISRTVQGKEITLEGKPMGYPVLVEDSERLYLNNLLMEKSEENRAYLDAVLYAYYSDMANKGMIVKVESHTHGVCVFINRNKQMVALQIPEPEGQWF